MATFVDTNWMNEAKVPRPVHCFNIYTGEDHGVREMNDDELACFKSRQHYVPIMETTSSITTPLDEEDCSRPDFFTRL